MSEQGQFDLCPKCGAVARDGVCQSCGYEIPGIENAVEQAPAEQMDAGQSAEGTQQADNTQQIDGSLYTTPDVYQTQSSQDVYQTPNTGGGQYDTGGMFSGEKTEQNADAQSVYQNPYVNSKYDHNPYENNAYGTNQTAGNQYGNNAYETNKTGNSQYGNNTYGAGQTGNNQYGNNTYGAGQTGNDQYGNNVYGTNQAGSSQYNNNPYGKKPYDNNQYGNQNQYGYSPYAAPPAKKHTGLIIGIVITAVVLFLIALFALIYHAVDSTPERKTRKGDTEYLEDFYREYFGDDWYREYRDDEYLEEFYLEYFGDNWYEDHLDEIEREKEREKERERDDNRDDDYYYDDDDDYSHDDYDYDDYYYNDYDDDEYYTLHDDIRDMSYSIEWEYYEYEPDDADVLILVEYPVVVGGHVPNLDRINDTIADEISVFTDYYEDEYSNYMYDDDSYFYASATGYVTYMSEDVLSVVYTEYVYTDYYDSVFMYSINIDMQDGVVLDNTDIIAVDDDFSIDFRYRSDEQNGAIDELDWLSDQEITELLTSPGNLIIFYTPQGMEIGFNYEDGWVTVTYHDYKDFLKIF